MQFDEKTMARIRSLTMENDRFFSLCLEDNPGGAELIIRILLGLELRVRRIEMQRWMGTLERKGSRLDALAEDEEGNLYNIEMQSNPQDASPRRARYYSAIMDTHTLRAGKAYEELPETYVIFLTSRDAIGDGKALHRFERREEETKEKLGDGTHIVYLSMENAEEGTEIGDLVHDMKCADPAEMHYNELSWKVRYFKEKEEGIERMGNEFVETYNEGRDEGIRTGRKEGLETGRKEGAAASRRETARTMIADGHLPLSKIAEYSGLSMGEVESIQNGMQF